MTSNVTVAARRAPDRRGEFSGLLARAAAGENEAFEDLVSPLLPRLRGYLRAQAGQEGEDLFGDVLLRAFHNLDRFSGTEAQFRSWVFTIAHHRLVDHRRRFRRTESIEQPAAWRLPGGDAEREAVDRLAERDLTRVLKLLPKAQREALLLRVVADLSVEQAAEVMGKSPGAVKVLQHRALESVRKKIRKEV